MRKGKVRSTQHSCHQRIRARAQLQFRACDPSTPLVARHWYPRRSSGASETRDWTGGAGSRGGDTGDENTEVTPTSESADIE